MRLQLRNGERQGKRQAYGQALLVSRGQSTIVGRPEKQLRNVAFFIHTSAIFRVYGRP